MGQVTLHNIHYAQYNIADGMLENRRSPGSAIPHYPGLASGSWDLATAHRLAFYMTNYLCNSMLRIQLNVFSCV